MAASQLALISKKIIKPSSPTPLIHRIQKLSIFDQLNPCSYMSFGMFFPKQYNHISTILEKVNVLKGMMMMLMCTSLSKFHISEMDYGWDGPRRVCLGSVPINKKIFLMDSQNEDGNEVLVSLKQEQMSALEANSN